MLSKKNKNILLKLKKTNKILKNKSLTKQMCDLINKEMKRISEEEEERQRLDRIWWQENGHDFMNKQFTI